MTDQGSVSVGEQPFPATGVTGAVTADPRGLCAYDRAGCAKGCGMVRRRTAGLALWAALLVGC